MAAALTAPAPSDIDGHECDEFACRDAVSHTTLCRCSCNGAGHGVNRGVNHDLGFAKPAITPAVRAARIARVFAASSDDAAF